MDWLYPSDWNAWLKKTIAFCLYFAPHLLIAPIVLVTVITFLHELGHAAVALGLGGDVYDFAFLPGADNLGHMQWHRPPGAPLWFDDLVSSGPYLMWSLFAAIVILIAIAPNKLHWAVASSLFCWGYFVPLADIAWNLYSGTGDLAIGGMEGIALVLVGTVLLLIAYGIGFWVQRRLFGDRAVDLVGYIAASVAVGGAFGIAALLGLFLFSGL